MQKERSIQRIIVSVASFYCFPGGRTKPVSGVVHGWSLQKCASDHFSKRFRCEVYATSTWFKDARAPFFAKPSEASSRRGQGPAMVKRTSFRSLGGASSKSKQLFRHARFLAFPSSTKRLRLEGSRGKREQGCSEFLRTWY